MTTILIVPGLGGSGPEHWQTLWERSDPRCERVEQRDWDQPELEDWIAQLEHMVQQAAGDVVLAAHSLGAILVAHWVRRGTTRKVKGALLVAPPNADAAEQMPAVIQQFAPVPRELLPFPSIVVASQDDPYAEIAYPRELAAAWGARFVDVGRQGHINAESGLGCWEQGFGLLLQLLGVS